MRVVCLALLLCVGAVVCSASVAPNENSHVSDDVELPASQDFYSEALGPLTTKPSWKPVIVFLNALNEDQYVEGRLEWFRAREADATFVFVVPPYRYIESRKQVLRAWYDFGGYVRKPSNLIGHDESSSYLTQVVQRLQELGRPVFLAGYGQGCAMAIDVAFSQSSASQLSKPLDGVACFSGYFIENKANDRALRETKLMWAHSQRDTQLPYSTARYGFDTMLVKERGLKNGQFVIFENKQGHGHVFNDESVDLLIDFVKGRRLPSQKTSNR